MLTKFNCTQFTILKTFFFFWDPERQKTNQNDPMHITYLRDGLNQLEGWEGLKPVLRAEPRYRMSLLSRTTRVERFRDDERMNMWTDERMKGRMNE